MNEDRDYCEECEEEGETEMSIINAVYKCNFCKGKTEHPSQWVFITKIIKSEEGLYAPLNRANYFKLCEHCNQRCINKDRALYLLNPLFSDGSELMHRFRVSNEDSIDTLFSNREELTNKIKILKEALEQIESGQVYRDSKKGKTPKTRARYALSAIKDYK